MNSYANSSLFMTRPTLVTYVAARADLERLQIGRQPTGIHVRAPEGHHHADAGAAH